MTDVHDMSCPKCKSNMIKSYGDEAKLRLKLIVWNTRGMFAVCKSCSAEVKIDMDLLKSVQSKFTYEVNGRHK